MTRSICSFLGVLVPVLAVLVPGSVHATDTVEVCPEPSKGKERNVVVFDHLAGAIVRPFPTVLRLRDGQAFGVRFKDTAPAYFDYQIQGIEADKVDQAKFTSDTERIEVGELSTTCLTWRHDGRQPLYRVTITLRKDSTTPEVVPQEGSQGQVSQQDFSAAFDALAADAQGQVLIGARVDDTAELYAEYSAQPRDFVNRVPDWLDPDLARRLIPRIEPRTDFLYSYTFPIWVETIGSRLSVTTGFAFSDLRGDGFFVQTDDQGTPDDADDDLKIVRRDRDAHDDFRPDIVALANLRAPHTWPKPWHRVGLSFGVGLGEESEPRYFFGPSFTLGAKEFWVLTLGWTGGKVEQLPPGQKVDAELVGTDLALEERFESGFYGGITFSFGGDKQKEFLAALKPTAAPQRTDQQKEPAADTEPDDGDD